MQPFISVIVPTRNRSTLLAHLLESLAQVRYADWEAIVVDDGSTDDTPAVVERSRARGLPVLYLYQPWSKMGAARNLGLERARGEIAAFTDDDCVVDPGWLDALAAAFADHPEALGVQGKTVTDHAAMTPFTRQVEQLEGGPPYRTCNIAYRTAILRELGGFDTQLIRGEDVVMGMRVLAVGPIIFAPDALVVHPPRPKEWADRRAWQILLESETHFRRTYPQYAAARSQTLSLQKAEHVVSRWLILPVRRYWRWHYAYFRRNPRDYLHHVPLMVREKLALLSLLPFFLQRWSPHPPAPSPSRGEGEILSVSVVVPTRNRADLLPRLLAALGVQEYPGYEVIVVDDASEDSTPAILEAWKGAGRRALRMDVPSGSYAARNCGWRTAGGEVVAFTDDDCLPEPGWLSGLVGALQEPGAVGAQGVTLADPSEVTPFTHQLSQRHPGPPYRTCNIAYRRSILERLDGFDASLRWYADNIFGLRARRLGSISFAPGAVVHHPPRPRTWRNRREWLARFQADARHRQELRRLGVEPVDVPGRILPVVLWVLRPFVKQGWAHVRYLVQHPAEYFREIGPMVAEKREMVLGMRDFWQEGHSPSPPGPLSRERERGRTGGWRERGSDVHREGDALPTLSERPLVSVVIVTRNRPHLLDGTLQALEQQSWPNWKVVVVDHGDGRGTRDLAHKRGARYVAAAGGTLAAARQAGIVGSRGEIVAFTDDDCLPDPHWLEALVSAFQRQPWLHGVQGRTEAEAGRVGSHAVRVVRPDPLYQTCNIAYRRAALEAAEGLDLRFTGWFEDTALAARVLAHGPIGFEAAAVVVHRAVPRRSLTRGQWRLLLEDEQRLARAYAPFYRRTRGPDFLSVVIARWLLGSPVKTLVRELPRAGADPGGYLRLARVLLHERRELVAALRDVVRTQKRDAKARSRVLSGQDIAPKSRGPCVR